MRGRAQTKQQNQSLNVPKVWQGTVEPANTEPKQPQTMAGHRRRPCLSQSPGGLLRIWQCRIKSNSAATQSLENPNVWQCTSEPAKTEPKQPQTMAGHSRTNKYNRDPVPDPQETSWRLGRTGLKQRQNCPKRWQGTVEPAKTKPKQSQTMAGRYIKPAIMT